MSTHRAIREHLTARHPYHWGGRLLNRFLRKLLPRLPLRGMRAGTSLAFHPIRPNPLSRSFTPRVAAEADRILDGYLEIFGELQVGNPIDWHKDYYSGSVWPVNLPSRKYVPCDLTQLREVKVPYEISRCHHLVVLSKAYHLTSDARYRERIIRDLESWLRENPYCRSINWTSVTDVAIRATNFVWTLEIGNLADSLPRPLVEEIKRSLHQHGEFIWRRLETYDPNYSTNHLIANLVGLIFISTTLEGDPRYRRWLRIAVRELYDAVRIQFLPSGPNYELSTSYHRFSAEMVMSAIARLERLGNEIPPDITARMSAALRYVRAYTRVDGTVPQIGDNDDGRLQILGEYHLKQRNDHRHLLALGHVLFGAQEFQQGDPAVYEDAAYQVPSRCPAEVDTAVHLKESTDSTPFPDAGIYIMRGERDHAIIKTSNLGLFGTAGYHNHNDVLSFELSLLGTALIVDPGTGLYSGNAELRNLFRSTRVHNTVMIDAVEQNEIGPSNDLRFLWALGDQASGKVLEWKTDEASDHLRALHRGYERLTSPVVHVRDFWLDRRAHLFRIRDEFISADGQSHNYSWNFTLHPGIQCEESSPRSWFLRSDTAVFELLTDIPLRSVKGLYSVGYRQTMPTMHLRGELNGTSRPAVFTIRRAADR